MSDENATKTSTESGADVALTAREASYIAAEDVARLAGFLANRDRASDESAPTYDVGTHRFDRGVRSTDSARLAEGNARLSVSFGDATFEAEGPSGVVLEAFAAFREQIGVERPPTQAPEVAAEASAPYDGDASPGAGESDGQELLPVFIKHRAVKTNAEVAAAIVTWAKRYDGHEELTPDDTERYWKLSGRKVPSNIPRDMSSAAGEGWLTRVGSGRYAITAYGERYVDGKSSV